MRAEVREAHRDLSVALELYLDLANSPADSAQRLKAWIVEDLRRSKAAFGPEPGSKVEARGRGARSAEKVGHEGSAEDVAETSAPSSAPLPVAPKSRRVVLTARETARRLNRSMKTLANWRSHDRKAPRDKWLGPPFTRWAGRVGYFEDDVETWVEGGSVQYPKQDE